MLPWWRPAYWRDRRKRWWAVRIVAAAICVFILLVAWLAITAPLNKSLEPIAPPQITLLAADGTPIARNGAIVDEPVKIATLPPHVVEAFLAIEDRRFYSHWGIDPRGIARAAFTGYGGGSTITQQLAKFTFLTSEQTLTRKAREMLIAFWLESWLTKDEILERYLSNAYFGDNVYGLRAASLHFFYRRPENLTDSQAAMLAGLVQAPSRYNPVKHYERAERRLQTVVGAMVAAGYLTEAEAARIRPPALDVRTKSDLPTGTYFADWALPQARELAESGYERQTLTTTLDSRLQNVARQVTSLGFSGRRTGGAGGDAAQWRGGGDDRGHRLRQIALQPGHAGEAPAGIDLQAVRLSRRASERLGSRRPHRQHRDRARQLSPQERAGPLFRKPDCCAKPSPSPAMSRRCACWRGGQRGGDRGGARSRRVVRAGRGRSQPGAGHQYDEPSGTDRRLCRDCGQCLSGGAARFRPARAKLVAEIDGRAGQPVEPPARGDGGHAAPGGQFGHGPCRHACRCPISARPAPRRTIAMRCSWAMRARARIGWSWASGSETTTIPRSARSAAARCLRASGATSCARRSAPPPRRAAIRPNRPIRAGRSNRSTCRTARISRWKTVRACRSAKAN